MKKPRLKLRISKKLPTLLPILMVSLTLGITLSLALSSTKASSDEIDQIRATSDLNQQSILYRHLLDRVGASAGQDMLKNAELPANGQTHLLNHTAGLYLYQKYGSAGLSQCKYYFLESCYHGFLLQAISDHGTPYLGQVMDSCKKEGAVVVAQCSHAFGHAFLVLASYAKLPDSLKMCDDQARTIKSLILFNCYDGVFMENVYGVHDGHPSPDRWVEAGDPTFPCDSKKISSQYLTACWSNQPALLYGLTGGNLSKVSVVCQNLSDHPSFQEACMNGLTRQINGISQGSPSKVADLCQVLPDPWRPKCITQNATSYFSLGDPQTAFSICTLTDSTHQADCFTALSALIKNSSASHTERTSWCAQIPVPNIKNSCLKQNS